MYLLNIEALIKTLVAQTFVNAPRCSMCANVIVALPLISPETTSVLNEAGSYGLRG